MGGAFTLSRIGAVAAIAAALAREMMKRLREILIIYQTRFVRRLASLRDCSTIITLTRNGVES